MADTMFALDAQRAAFAHDVLTGLSLQQKTLPSRWLYDDRGSLLYEEITQVTEYYPARTETAILKDHADQIGEFIGPHAAIIEYGAGACVKTAVLLQSAPSVALYAPVDIAGDFLETTVSRLRETFPDLAAAPIVADFNDDFDLPPTFPQGNRVTVFLGSTIGNLSRRESYQFLRRIRRHAGEGGKALIGIDLQKDIRELLAAYDDRAGITAAFNLNLLVRANRELGATFDLSGFRHESRWNKDETAVEMHLVSRRTQSIVIGERCFNIGAGETIHTETSRKYQVEEFAVMAARAGWALQRVWTDKANRFALLGMGAATEQVELS